jgi:hypothetical protein
VNPTLDTDGDGIPDVVEVNVLHTSPTLKTLFVKPYIEDAVNNGVYTFWAGFKADLFPDDDPDPVYGARPGFATVPPFRDRQIEVSIIGDPAHPYWRMRQLDYDPATDPERPPCDIMVVYYERVDAAAAGSLNGGHTFFNGQTWSWDTKGFTRDALNYTGPANPDPSSAWYSWWVDHQHYLKYGYHTPRVYAKPLDNYVHEGAYQRIALGEPPGVPPTGPSSDGVKLYCSASSCGLCSPMNVDDDESGPPYMNPPDGTVERSKIDYVTPSEVNGSKKLGQIEQFTSWGTPYLRNAVLARTLVHEMGHALLAASNSLDHCNVDECIMSGFTETWELYDFGDPNGCKHGEGGSLNIPEKILNSVH